MKKVVELYKGILPAFGLTVDTDDRIWIGGGELGTQAPLSIDGKNVFIPTDEFLKNSEFRDQVAFHPLMENILKQPSQVLHTLQSALTTRMFITGSFIIQGLLATCAKQKAGQEISSPKLLKYLSGNEGADDKTLKFFKDIIEVIEKDTSKKLFSVYLKFGGKMGGKEVLRQCSITSPLLEALERTLAIGSGKPGTISVWGVAAPRKKDVELLINVIKSAFPKIEEKGYSRGSNNPIAPYCDSIFEAALAFNQDAIEIAKALSKQEPVSSLISYILIELEPLEELLGTESEWDVYRNTIMKTAYNEGEGWNTEANKTNIATSGTDYKVVKETAASTSSEDLDKPADVVAISKTIIANQVKRVPGTRQPLVTIPEEEKGSLTRNPRSNYGGEREERRGFERESYYGSKSRFEGRNSGPRLDPRDMTERELEDTIKELRDEIHYIDRNGSYEERRDIRRLEDELDECKRELDYRDRDRGYESRGRRDDYERRDRNYGRQSSRPVPRVMENQRGRRERERPTRRFANRY